MKSTQACNCVIEEKEQQGFETKKKGENKSKSYLCFLNSQVHYRIIGRLISTCSIIFPVQLLL